MTADNFLREKTSIEATILEEVRNLQRELSAEKCRPISMLNIVTEAVYNIVSAVTIGERYRYLFITTMHILYSILELIRFRN